MKTFTRKEYNLVANALQKYDLYMSDSEKKIAEIIQDKLYYFNVDKEVDKASTSIDNEIKSLIFR